MFDLGFSEIAIIGVVALIVLGPERLPRAARTLGNWVSRMQRYVNDVKADINREIELTELRKFHDEMKGAASAFEHTIRAEAGALESSIGDPFRAVEPGDAAGPAAPAAAPDYEARAVLAGVRPSYVPRPIPAELAARAATRASPGGA